MARKPYDEMDAAERAVFWDAIARRGEQPLSPEEKAKLHEGASPSSASTHPTRTTSSR